MAEPDRIRVAVRVRPPNQRELSQPRFASCIDVDEGAGHLTIGSGEERERSYQFDLTFGEQSSQEQVFQAVAVPVVDNCLSGFNGTIFAYGQTGSGKSFTIMGPESASEDDSSPLRGLLPRVLEHIFCDVQAKREAAAAAEAGNVEFAVRASYLEIYNERVYDLLDPASSGQLQIREDKKTGIYVDRLSEETVGGALEAMSVMRRGARNRRVGSTAMNRESSRSHSVFTLAIESSHTVAEGLVKTRRARFHVIDLAGSERARRTGAGGERLKEASSINKSLSALGKVIHTLVEVAAGRPKHIPYRDSKLTFLLRDSLGGNSRTTLVATVSPSDDSLAETLSTLNFASRAKKVKTTAVANEDTSGSIAQLQAQIKALRKRLAVHEGGSQLNRTSSAAALPLSRLSMASTLTAGSMRRSSAGLSIRDSIGAAASGLSRVEVEFGLPQGVAGQVARMLLRWTERVVEANAMSPEGLADPPLPEPPSSLGLSGWPTQVISKLQRARSRWPLKLRPDAHPEADGEGARVASPLALMCMLQAVASEAIVVSGPQPSKTPRAAKAGGAATPRRSVGQRRSNRRGLPPGAAPTSSASRRASKAGDAATPKASKGGRQSSAAADGEQVRLTRHPLLQAAGATAAYVHELETLLAAALWRAREAEEARAGRRLPLASKAFAAKVDGDSQAEGHEAAGGAGETLLRNDGNEEESSPPAAYTLMLEEALAAALLERQQMARLLPTDQALLPATAGVSHPLAAMPPSTPKNRPVPSTPEAVTRAPPPAAAARSPFSPAQPPLSAWIALRRRDAEVEAAEREAAAACDAAKAAELQAHQARQEAESQRQAAAASEARVEALERELAAARAEAAASRDADRSGAAQAREALCAAHAEAMDKVQGLLAAARVKEAAAESAGREASQAAETATRRCVEAEAEAEAAEKRAAAAEEAAAEAAAGQGEAERRAEAAEAARNEHRTTAEQAVRAKEEVEAALRAAQAQASKLQLEADQREFAVAQAEEDIEELGTQLRFLQGKRRKLEAQVAEAEDAATGLRSELAAAQAEATAARESLRAERARAEQGEGHAQRADELEAQAAEAAAAADGLRAELRAVQTERAAEREAAAATRAELASSQEREADLRSTLADVQAELLAAREAAEDTAARLATAEAEAAEVGKELEEARAEAATAAADAAAAAGAAEEVEAKLRKDLSTARSARASAERHLDELTSRLAGLSESLEETTKTLASTRATLASSQLELHEAQQQLEAEQDARETDRSDADREKRVLLRQAAAAEAEAERQAGRVERAETELMEANSAREASEAAAHSAAAELAAVRQLLAAHGRSDGDEDGDGDGSRASHDANVISLIRAQEAKLDDALETIEELNEELLAAEGRAGQAHAAAEQAEAACEEAQHRASEAEAAGRAERERAAEAEAAAATAQAAAQSAERARRDAEARSAGLESASSLRTGAVSHLEAMVAGKNKEIRALEQRVAELAGSGEPAATAAAGGEDKEAMEALAAELQSQLDAAVEAAAVANADVSSLLELCRRLTHRLVVATGRLERSAALLNSQGPAKVKHVTKFRKALQKLKAELKAAKNEAAGGVGAEGEVPRVAALAAALRRERQAVEEAAGVVRAARWAIDAAPAASDEGCEAATNGMLYESLSQREQAARSSLGADDAAAVERAMRRALDAATTPADEQGPDMLAGLPISLLSASVVSALASEAEAADPTVEAEDWVQELLERRVEAAGSAIVTGSVCASRLLPLLRGERVVATLRQAAKAETTVPEAETTVPEAVGDGREEARTAAGATPAKRRGRRGGLAVTSPQFVPLSGRKAARATAAPDSPAGVEQGL